MSRLTRLFILILISMLVCVSCKKETSTKEPTYNIFRSPESTDISSNDTDITSTPSNSNIPTEETTADKDTFVNEANNGSSSNKTSSITQEEQWPYPLDFKGITPTGAYKTGNLVFNHYKVAPTTSNIICPDLDNNILYYVNYDLDNYVYKLKDGISSVVIEKDAFQLSLWENKLYFLSKNENSGPYDGDIYCYDLDIGELQLLQKTNARHLFVDSLGIYYEEKINSNNDDKAYYRLDFDGNNAEILDSRYYLSYYDYQIIQNESGVVLQHNESKEEFFIAPYEYGNYGVAIYNDHIVFNRNSVFYMINLLNGDRKAIRWSNAEKDTLTTDFVVMNNTIYIPHLLTIDLSSNIITKYSVTAFEKKDDFRPESVYSDGNQIYAVVNYPYLSLKKLVKLEYSNATSTHTGKLQLKVKDIVK